MSGRRVYLALDAHARHSVLGEMDARGQFRRSWRFRTCEEELIRHVDAVMGGMKKIVVEEGPLTFWIAQTIRCHVDEVVIADPRENHLISRNAMKGDKVDVRQLCRLLRLGEIKKVYHPEEDERAIFKAAVRQYIDFRDQESSLKRKIKAKYRSWGIEDIDGVRIYHARHREAFLARLRHEPVRHQLERLYVVMDAALRMQALALREADRLAGSYPEIVEFRKVPGVGVVGSLIFDAYIQTPHRFPTKSCLWRYCRLAVTDRTSDGRPLGYKRLERTGNSELKAMSYRSFLAAMRIRRPNEVREFFERSLKVTHQFSHARLNTQRKLLAVLHGIWRKGEAYNPKMFLGSDSIALSQSGCPARSPV